MKLLDGVMDSLRARLENLDGDFDSWLSRSEVSTQLEQHHTQVRRVTRILNGMIKFTFAASPLRDDAASPELEQVPDLRRSVGSMHVIWDFFRDKFAQRDVENVATHLFVADDFAWELYKPFLDAAQTAGKLNGKNVSEPPLVFYSPFRSPYAQARTKQFQPLGIDAKDFKQFQDILVAIPIPVVGVPWASANRLPDLVVVGHETGHIVAEDLGLAKAAKQALTEIEYPNDDGSRKKCWISWSDEIFADIFGVLATGKAFVAGLAGELADDRSTIRFAEIEKSRPGEYPSPSLRIEICEAVLEKLGVTPNDNWFKAYGTLVGDSDKFVNDVELVVGAMFDRKWSQLGMRRLVDLLPWNLTREQHVEQIATNAIGLSAPPGPFSVRNWIAGAMLASRTNPVEYLENGLDVTLAKQIVAQRKVGVRSNHTESIRAQMHTAESIPMGPGVDPQAATDEELGRELAMKMRLIGN